MPEAIKETDYLCLTYSNRVDAALWHFKVCSKWAAPVWLGIPVHIQARVHGSRCRSSTCVTCAAEESWRAGRALGHCWALSSGGSPRSCRTSLGIFAEVDVSHSKINLSTRRFFAIRDKLPGHPHYHILPRVGSKRRSMCLTCRRASAKDFGLLWRLNTFQFSPSGPFKLAASGHIFLRELSAE